MCSSRCGKLCGECPHKEEYGCAGCINITDGYWGSKCEIKVCCEGRKLEHCGLCKEFPCEILREFCYDKETGDDGERLMNCKKWADEKREETEKVIKRVLLGVSFGGIAGVIIGEMQGAVAAFAIVGIVVGAGVAAMLTANNRKR